MISTTTRHSRRSLLAFFEQDVDGDLLIWFRIVFGICGLAWAVKQIRGHAIEALYLGPSYHFHYFGFEWVELGSPTATVIEFYVLGAAALCIALGVWYRLAAIVFAFIFTHLFLVDKCLYLNHYYLLTLVAWLMCIMPCRPIWSRKSPFRVPLWTLWLVRYQIALPYVFGSIAKWNGDWLAGEPIRSMLLERSDYAVIGPLLAQPLSVNFFVWGGLLYDLFVVPGLLIRRTRLLTVMLTLLFHGTNAWLFTIGVFPWFMLFSTPIFFPPGSIRGLLGRVCRGLRRVFRGEPNALASGVSRENDAPLGPRLAPLAHQADATEPPPASRAGTYLKYSCIAAFVLIQAIMPLRHFAIPGNVSWTEEGHCFSWHMLVRGKRSALRIVATDKTTGTTGAIDLRRYVTPLQLPKVARDPRLILQLAHHIEHDLRVKGFESVELRAIALVSLNGRKPQHLIDPSVDLVTAEVGWGPPEWIVPLREPLRKEAWTAPLSTWEQAVAEPN